MISHLHSSVLLSPSSLSSLVFRLIGSLAHSIFTFGTVASSSLILIAVVAAQLSTAYPYLSSWSLFPGLLLNSHRQVLRLDPQLFMNCFLLSSHLPPLLPGLPRSKTRSSGKRVRRPTDSPKFRQPTRRLALLSKVLFLLIVPCLSYELLDSSFSIRRRCLVHSLIPSGFPSSSLFRDRLNFVTSSS